MTHRLRLALVGIGKIARDQHLPAIAADPAFELVAAVSRNARVEGVANFATIDALVASGLALDAVVIATPPMGRHRIAATALAAGWHVMVEKPPGATLAELRQLVPGDRTLCFGWHSRHAAGVAAAKRWLGDCRITGGAISWREDIRVWHPGQDWILAAGGLGVFDPGINALSILTLVLPAPVWLSGAALDFPANRAAPIAATLALACAGAPISGDFDFRHAGTPCWRIRLATDSGELILDAGGAELSIDGAPQQLPATGEYPGLYQHFARLIASGASDCDATPLELVADAFLIGERRQVAAFDF
jgi:D-galactose 1-dehydrogenase